MTAPFFIEDLERARSIASALESQGWSVFWDRHIPHGQDFNSYIQSQLDEARWIIVLWSQAAVASQFVRDEASEGLGGRLVPLLLEKVRPPPWIPPNVWREERDFGEGPHHG